MKTEKSRRETEKQRKGGRKRERKGAVPGKVVMRS